MAAAAKAVGKVVFEGEPGTEIPSGTKLERNDGTRFTTVDHAEVGDSGEVTVLVAADKAGKKGESAAGEVLALVAAIDGLADEAIVTTDGLVLRERTAGAGAAAEASSSAAPTSAAAPEDAEGDEDGADRVMLTVALNGGSVVRVPARIVDARALPSGATLYDLSARLPDGRQLSLEGVRQRPEGDVEIPPFWDAITAQLEV